MQTIVLVLLLIVTLLTHFLSALWTPAAHWASAEPRTRLPFSRLGSFAN